MDCNCHVLNVTNRTLRWRGTQKLSSDPAPRPLHPHKRYFSSARKHDSFFTRS